MKGSPLDDVFIVRFVRHKKTKRGKKVGHVSKAVSFKEKKRRIPEERQGHF